MDKIWYRNLSKS